MNPLDWSFPVAVTWLILFGIILARAGGTYLLGRLARNGIRRIDRVDRLMSGRKYRKAEAMINRYGSPVIALSFLTVGLQTVLNLAAGTSGMSARRYIPALIIGGSAWALVYSTVGFLGFQALAKAYALAPGLTVGLVACFALAVAGLIIGLKRKDDPAQMDYASDPDAADSGDAADADGADADTGDVGDADAGAAGAGDVGDFSDSGSPGEAHAGQARSSRASDDNA